MTGWTALPLGEHVLAESPRWDPGRRRLSWVDLVGRTLAWAERDRTGGWGPVHRVRRDGPLTAAEPVGDGWWVAIGSGVVPLGPDGRPCGPERVVTTEHPAVRTNDLGRDPSGRLLVGLFTEDRVSPDGGLVVLDPSTGSEVSRVGGLVTANGIGCSPDGAHLYVVDTARATLNAYAYDVAAGRVGPARVLVREPGPGRLDGLAVDPAGKVWVAVWDAGEVRRYASDGRLLATLPTPVARPSAVALVDDDLVVTTARSRLDPVDPPPPDPEGRLYAYPLSR